MMKVYEQEYEVTGEGAMNSAWGSRLVRWWAMYDSRCAMPEKDLDFPGGSEGKASAYNSGDLGSKDLLSGNINSEDLL